VKDVKMRVEPRYDFMFNRLQSITLDDIARAMPNAQILQFTPTIAGYLVDLRFGEVSNEAAMNTVLALLQECGYWIAEATLSEWANGLVECMVTGAVSGLGIGSKTKNDIVAFSSLLVGAALGGMIGQSVKWEKVIYEVHRDSEGWRFVPIRTQPFPIASLLPSRAATG
jgi:hypothetical protein